MGIASLIVSVLLMLAGTTDATLFESAVKHFEPRARVRSIAWMRDYAQTDTGRPYDHGAFPYLGAPGGPCDALDDMGVRTIVLQWASRCGKTQFGQWAQQFLADTQPGPMMFASSDQKLAVEIIARQYRSLERNPRFRGQLLPKHLRRQDQIVLSACRVFVAWSRSVSTLADKAIRWGHANEIDKWEHQSTSREADPLKLFSDRFKDYPTHKKILDGTPTVRDKSRVERARLVSTNCKLHVPCPHCRRYQVLRFGKPGVAGGIAWDKLPGGAHDKDLARRTGHYVCEHCSAKILDQHRAEMVRRGVWCPEGCTVNDAEAWRITEPILGGDGASQQEYLTDRYQWKGWSQASWIEGRPARDGADAGYQLSSLYALSLGWGDIAAEFVASKDSPADLQNFINQWLGDTWELRSRKQTWEQLGERIIDQTQERGVCPPWASLVTIGIDRQQDEWAYVVDAWGDGRKSATLAYGYTKAFEEVRAAAIEHAWQHADGGAPIRAMMTLVDSGYRAEGVYDYCRDCLHSQPPLQVWPCKGSSNSLNADWRESKLGPETKGMRLFWVDTSRTQEWIDKVLHDLRLTDAGSTSVYQGSGLEHCDFLTQLLNDAVSDKLDKHNNPARSWDRINANIPNEYRDCLRYAYAAMLIATRGAPIRPRAVLLAEASMQAGQQPKRFTTPDGRPFLITDRT